MYFTMRTLWTITAVLAIALLHNSSATNAKLGFIVLEDDYNFNLTWQDNGSNMPTTASFYVLVNTTVYSSFGDYLQPNYYDVGVFDNWNIPYGPPIAIRESLTGDKTNITGDPLLLPITQFEKLWDSTYYYGDTNCSIWRPISPHPDYVVLGDVLTFGLDTYPVRPAMAAVHKSCVTTCQTGPMLWDSWNYEGTLNANIYGVASPDGSGVTGSFWTVVSESMESTSANTWPCLSKSCLTGADPQQVHIATGTDIGTFRINWVSYEPSETSTVRYGTQPGDYTDAVKGEQYAFVDGGINRRKEIFHKATVSGLSPNTTYYYQVGDKKGGWSPEFYFKTLSEGFPELNLLVYGDFGYENSQSFRLLNQEVASKKYDMILHVGDLAYDMDDHDGKRGDDFMRMVEPLAAHLPYMVCPGNHEQAWNFTHFMYRFDNMPGEECGSDTNLFYSWDYSFVHFVSFTSEAYFAGPPTAWGQLQAQYQWLEQDLAQANKNRDKRPWIIAMAHRPMYCSDDSKKRSPSVYTDCTSDAATLREGPDGIHYGMEKLLWEYGVDLYLTAHEHSYERMYPVYNNQVFGTSYVNPEAPVHILSGSAGCPEGLDGFGAPGPWTAFRSESYGYGRLHVYNGTVLHWEQISDSDGSVLDEITLIQENHGPFGQH